MRGESRVFVKFRITCIICIIALLFSFSLAFPQSEEPEHPADVKQAETVQPEQDVSPQTAAETGEPEKGETETVPHLPKGEQAPTAGPEEGKPAISPQQPKVEQALPAEPARKPR